MGSWCSRGKSNTVNTEAFDPSTSPVENSSLICRDKRRRRLSMSQSTDVGLEVAASSEVDETRQRGRIVTGSGSPRRLSITSQAVEDQPTQQKGFEDKTCKQQGATVPKTMGYVCKKGLKPDMPNQDDFAILVTDDYEMYAVFDGHGPYGHAVSKLCQKILPEFIRDDPNFQEDLPKAFKTAFIRAHVMCERASDSQDQFDCAFSGSTATIVLLRNASLNCAWVGDSRAVLATLKTDGRLVAVDLSRDHKPELPDEKARIESQGGRVLKLGNDIPYRVFVKNAHYPGLAMARSIGDSVGVTAGISHIPEVSQRNINDSADKFIIIASDGVWEFISSQEAVNIINKYKPSEAQTAAEVLAQEAWMRWIREEHGKVVDDITIIINWL